MCIENVGPGEEKEKDGEIDSWRDIQRERERERQDTGVTLLHPCSSHKNNEECYHKDGNSSRPQAYHCSKAIWQGQIGR